MGSVQWKTWKEEREGKMVEIQYRYTKFFNEKNHNCPLHPWVSVYIF